MPPLIEYKFQNTNSKVIIIIYNYDEERAINTLVSTVKDPKNFKLCTI